MTRSLLLVLIGILVVVSAALGYALYQEREKTSGVAISVGPKGIAVEKK